MATKPISYEVITLARWLARKAIKAELRAAGLRPEHVAVSEIAAAADAYFKAHRDRLIDQASILNLNLHRKSSVRILTKFRTLPNSQPR